MIGIILGIFGIVITIGFGIYSVVIYKKSRKTVNLEFENKECYSLFRDDVNRLNIELSYNKKPITSTLILLKARLKNNGQVDIDKNRIYNPLKIISSPDFKWLEATVISKPNGASASIKIIDSHNIQVNWDLLKKDEFIDLEALSETTENKDLGGEKSLEFYNSLKFDYRITDLGPIYKEKQVTSQTRRHNFIMKLSKFYGIGAIILGVIHLSIAIFTQHSYLSETQNVAYIVQRDSTENDVYISSNKPNQIKIKFRETEVEENLTVLEFNKKYKLKGIDSTTLDTKWNPSYRVFGILFIFLGSLNFILIFLSKRGNKKAANKDV